MWEEPPTAEPWDGPAVPDEPRRTDWDGCTCLTYGHGISLTRVVSRRCEIHGEPNGEED